MAQLHDLTLTEQATAVRAKEVSPVALVSHYLARIDRYDQTLRSFVTLTPDAALDAAKVAERAVMNGGPLPPLHGVPIALKDLTPTAGVRTTFGSAAFADFVPDYDHDVVRLLREAGTISLGKTATSEFGCSLYTETRLGPPTRNPWRTDLIPGGSSGGAAAAVAAGLVPAAQGSDGGGSLRIPASLCGLVGYKPTRGLVPGGPLGFGAFGLPTQGPLGRTVADVAILLEVMSAPQPGEPYVPPPQFRAGALRDHVDKPLTIGRYATPILGHAPVDPAVLAVWDDASRLLADLGHTVTDVAAPFDEAVLPEFEVLWSALSLSPVPPGTEELLLPLTRWLRARGAATPVAAVLAALNSLQSRVRQAMRALDGYDLLLSPVLAGVAAEVGSFAALDPAEDFRRQAEFSPFCAAYNLTGQPAVSLPLGRSPDGLPIGVMLAARPGRDLDLLAVAGRLEQARGWADRHPDTWRG